MKFSFHDWLVSCLANVEPPPCTWEALKGKDPLYRIAMIRLGWMLKHNKARLVYGEPPVPEEQLLRYNVVFCDLLHVPCKTHRFDFLHFSLGRCDKCGIVHIVAHNRKSEMLIKDRMSAALTVFDEFRKLRYLFVGETINRLVELLDWMTYHPQDTQAILSPDGKTVLPLELLDRLKRWYDTETLEVEGKQ